MLRALFDDCGYKSLLCCISQCYVILIKPWVNTILLW